MRGNPVRQTLTPQAGGGWGSTGGRQRAYRVPNVAHAKTLTVHGVDLGVGIVVINTLNVDHHHLLIGELIAGEGVDQGEGA